MHRRGHKYNQPPVREADEYHYESRVSGGWKDEPKLKRREQRDSYDESLRRVNRGRKDHYERGYDTSKDDYCHGDINHNYREPTRKYYEEGDNYDERNHWGNEENGWHDHDERVKRTIRIEDARQSREISRGKYYNDCSHKAGRKGQSKLQDMDSAKVYTDYDDSRPSLSAREHVHCEDSKISSNQHGNHNHDDVSHISSRSKHSRNQKEEMRPYEFSKIRSNQERLGVINESDFKLSNAIVPPAEIRIWRDNDTCSSSKRERAIRHGDKVRRNHDYDAKSLRSDERYQKEQIKQYNDSYHASPTFDKSLKRLDEKSASSSKSKSIGIFNFFKRNKTPNESIEIGKHHHGERLEDNYKAETRELRTEKRYDDKYIYHNGDQGNTLYVSGGMRRDDWKDGFREKPLNEKYYEKSKLNERMTKANRVDAPLIPITGKAFHKNTSQHVLHGQEADCSEDYFEYRSAERIQEPKHVKDGYEYKSDEDGTTSTRRRDYVHRKNNFNQVERGEQRSTRYDLQEIILNNEKRGFPATRQRKEPDSFNRHRHNKSRDNSRTNVQNLDARSYNTDFSHDDNSSSSRSFEKRQKDFSQTKRTTCGNEQNAKRERNQFHETIQKQSNKQISIEKPRNKIINQNEGVSKHSIPKSALGLAVLQDIKKGDVALKTPEFQRLQDKEDFRTQDQTEQKLNSAHRYCSSKPNKPTSILDEIKSGTKTLKKVKPSSTTLKHESSDATLNIIRARRKLLEKQKHNSFGYSSEEWNDE